MGPYDDYPASVSQAIEPKSLAVVVPVYQGEHTLPALVDELQALRDDLVTEDASFRLHEVILVHDCGPDGSVETIEKLEASFDWVRAVWLTRNYGQHPATIAGISATSTDWVVTMDEDGLHDPADIRRLVAQSEKDASPLIYAQSGNRRPHSAFRNLSSRVANRAFGLLVGSESNANFSSFRLLDGPIGRGLAAYCGHGVYLDVALSWVMPRTSHVDVHYRDEIRGSDQGSGYHFRSLLSHFRRLVLTSGTRPLRAIAVLGVVTTVVGLLVAIGAVALRLFGDVDQAGWTSVIIAISVFSGIIMIALGTVAEYLSVAVTMAAGRPLYMTTSTSKWSCSTGSAQVLSEPTTPAND